MHSTRCYLWSCLFVVAAACETAGDEPHSSDAATDAEGTGHADAGEESLLPRFDGGNARDGGRPADSGIDADAQSRACPTADPRCSLQQRTEACAAIAACDTLPGSDADPGQCIAEIGPLCVHCVTWEPMFDGGSNEAFSCADGFPTSGCLEACRLATAPTPAHLECLTLHASLGGSSIPDPECLCGWCVARVAACYADQGCERVVTCSYEKGCTGMSCYAPETCRSVIDEVGATSLSVALATELSNCTASCGVLESNCPDCI